MRTFLRGLRRSPVLQFAASGLLATLVIGLIAVAVGRHAGTTEAIRDAKAVTRLAGNGIVAPAVTPGVLDGDPAALRRLDRAVRTRVLGGDVVRVKIWAADGRIVYSDEPRLVGARYPLDDEDRAAFRSATTQADLSDLSRPENRFERGGGKLLEVYLPIRDQRGRPLLFETYLRYSAVSASGRRLWLAFAPALLGGLLLLQLVNLPLARSLARRLRRAQGEREGLLTEALDASQTERRRIAGDLHDGVVQDLVGVSYALAAQAEHVDGEARTALRAGAATTRESVRALRTLLVDIYPPSLHRSGLAAALGDLARTTTARGVATSVDLAPDVGALAEPTERLLFRVAQESLRNTAKHAQATSAHIAVRERREDGRVVLQAVDDGRGFDPDVLRSAEGPPGHFGFRVLRDLVEHAGGRLDVDSAAGRGTTVRVELPA